jgi:hypothetical protein
MLKNKTINENKLQLQRNQRNIEQKKIQKFLLKIFIIQILGTDIGYIYII